MKTIKFLLVSLFMMLGLAAQAQQVVINKTDGTVDVFQLNEVDSVVYKPAPKYYYYAGWECPTNEDDLKSKGTLIGNFSTAKSGDKLVLSSEWGVTTATRGTGYYVIPEGTAVYDNSFNIDAGFEVSSTLTCGGIKYNVFAVPNAKVLGTTCYLIKL